jgi:hypothetical protein
LKKKRTKNFQTLKRKRTQKGQIPKMEQANKHIVAQLSNWNLEQCIQFLEISESNQRKRVVNPNPNPKLNVIKHAIQDRILDLTGLCETNSCIFESDYTMVANVFNSTSYVLEDLLRGRKAPLVRHGNVSSMKEDMVMVYKYSAYLHTFLCNLLESNASGEAPVEQDC